MQVMHDVEVAEEQVTERRGEPRRQVLENALIVFNNAHCSMGCQIINMSDIGAELMPTGTSLCPGEFVLKLQSGEARHCAVMWRRETQMGVHYT